MICLGGLGRSLLLVSSLTHRRRYVAGNGGLWRGFWGRGGRGIGRGRLGLILGFEVEVVVGGGGGGGRGELLGGAL